MTEDSSKWEIAKILIAFEKDMEEYNFSARFEALQKAIDDIWTIIETNKDEVRAKA